MKQTSFCFALFLAILLVVAQGRLLEKHQQVLSQETSTETKQATLSEFLAKFISYVTTGGKTCKDMSKVDQVIAFEQIISAFPMKDSVAQVSKDDVKLLPEGAIVYDDITFNICGGLEHPEKIGPEDMTKLQLIFDCLGQSAQSIDHQKEVEKLRKQLEDKQFDQQECLLGDLKKSGVGKAQNYGWSPYSLFLLGKIIDMYFPAVSTSLPTQMQHDDTALPKTSPPSNLKVTVVEYYPVRSGATLAAKISENIRALHDATPQGDGHSLVLFPEYGIINDAYIDVSQDKSLMVNLFLMRVFGGSLPHGGFPSWKAGQNRATLCPTPLPQVLTLEHLSCVASKKNTYVLVNVLMKSPAWSLYNIFTMNVSPKVLNVNLLFNPQGDLIHVYEKMYPVPAEATFVLHATNKPDLQIVEIDNGIFRSMVCYDLLFSTAGYYRRTANVLFATEWSSGRDLVSILAQQAFSRATVSNMFAANINGDTLKDTGSGIYLAGKPVGVVARNGQPVAGVVGYHLHPTAQSKAYATVTATVDVAHAPEKYFTEDNVNILIQRRKIPIEATGRTTIKVCAGTNCQGTLQAGEYTRDEANVFKVTNVEQAITLKSGKLTCEFKLKLAGDVPNEKYILQADNAFTVGETQFTTFVKAAIGIKNRKVLNCMLLRVGDHDNKTTWGDYNGMKQTAAKLEVAITANNLGLNTEVLPILGLANQAGIHPYTLEEGRRSSWTTADQKGPTTTLTAIQTAADSKHLVIASLYGVQVDM